MSVQDLDEVASAPDVPPGRRGRRAARRASWGSYGRYPLFVLALLGFVEALERRILPGVITLVQEDLGFSDLKAGLLDSALIVAALLVAVPAGILADRLDRRKFVAGAFAAWATVTALTGTVRSFGQLFVLRAALGAGDAINDPADQSLIADYYPPKVRGRAYGIQRVTPTVGSGLGLALGAALGAAFGWRTALVVMALPGLVVALMVYRLREPARGHSETAEVVVPSGTPMPGPSPVAEPSPGTATSVAALSGLSTLPTRARIGWLLRVRSLRALLLATAVTSGILGSVAFWGVAYHERASGLDLKTAGVVGGVPVLFGALFGALGGGWLVDHLRDRVKGAPLLVAGCMTALGSIIFTIGFLDGLPLYAVRLPLHGLAVGLLVGALPATTAMTAEVVPAELRGTAFGLLKLSSNLLAAALPPIVGAIADANQILDDEGKSVGDLGLGFRLTIPFILVGSALLLSGRRYVAQDIAAARSGTRPEAGPGGGLDGTRLVMLAVGLVLVASLIAAMLLT